MSLSQNPVHEVFPYQRVKGTGAAISCYKDVFGAKENSASPSRGEGSDASN